MTSAKNESIIRVANSHYKSDSAPLQLPPPTVCSVLKDISFRVLWLAIKIRCCFFLLPTSLPIFTMKEEVHCACEFFSKMLESKHLPHQFATQFRLRLEELLSQRFKNHWDVRNPNKGSAFRCIRINSKMDPIVSEAAKATGLKDISKYLPAEFTMWIDPRDVSYRFGEEGSICSCPLDFMVTRSEWSSTPTVATVSNSLPGSRAVSQPARSRSSPSSPPPPQSSRYYHHQVYRNLSNRLVQVQVWFTPLSPHYLYLESYRQISS